MDKCKLELFLLLMFFCTSEVDINSLFLTTNKIYTDIGEARLPNFLTTHDRNLCY
jgi:hypothetical protein